MNIELKEITARELTNGYKGNAENGVATIIKNNVTC
jgi:hypothetical protein